MERDFIEKLLERTDLATLIGKYVPLKRKGRTLWGCCPFHNEHEPSFAVNDDKQFYHCFGCKESGNAITFLTKIERIEFIDAVKMLADTANMPLPEQAFSADYTANKKKRERLLALLKDAARHYHDNLVSGKSVFASEYLVKRAVPQNLITKFGLGASVSFEEMLAYLNGLGYTNAEMKEAGIAEQKGSYWYDVFGERLIFPIIDGFGAVVAFGGRLLKEENFAKYRNSSQTAVFDKSKTVYALNLLKKRKVNAPVDYIIMTEGYMDVIALHKAGFDTAVASMGTALTASQAKQIKNYCQNVYISYDGDTAGQKATMRGLDILNQHGLNVKVVELPQGMDPDDIIKQGGAEAYSQLLQKAVTLTAFKLKVLQKQYDTSTPDGKSSYAIEASKLVAALRNPVEIQRYLEMLSQITGYSVDVLRQQADITPVAAPVPAPVAAVKPEEPYASEKLNQALEFVMAAIAQGEDYADFETDLYVYLPDEFYRSVYSYVKEARQKGIKASSGLFEAVEDQARLSKLFSYQHKEGDGAQKFNNCVQVIMLESLTRQLEQLSNEYDRTKNAACLREANKLSAQIRKLKNQ